MLLRWERFYLLGPMILAAGVFLTGVNWGLPSRKVDPLLFGDRPVWSGRQIVDLVGERGSLSIGADVDANPNRLRPVVVNDADAKRAEILVRYRLYSYQPDEMITFRALASMPKTRGDPRLYQYGGLWVYPVGVLLKIGSWVGLVDVRSDLAFYLDHPEAFGRFYIVARLYVVAFALLGVWGIFWLTRKITGDPIVAMFACIAYALMPVVINMAHEAKPHLPGAVLILLALVTAVRYIETASRRWALGAGALCGAAFGMVLTGALSFILLPVMCYVRWRSRPPLAPSRLRVALVDFLSALAIGILVYAFSNPFVIIHLLGDRTILLSNLGNSQAMYRTPMSTDTILHAGKLIADGATPVIATAGALAILAFRKDLVRKLALVVTLPILAQFIALATDKPGEYARFGLVPDIVLMLCAIHAINSITRKHAPRLLTLTLVCVATGIWSIGYVWHFARDSIQRTPRIIVAERLQELQVRGAREMSIYADPAPYCLPPVNLFDWKIVLLDSGAAPPTSSDLLIRPIDEIPKKDMPMRGFDIVYWTRPRLLDTPISWASKPFQVIVRRELVDERIKR